MIIGFNTIIVQANPIKKPPNTSPRVCLLRIILAEPNKPTIRIPPLSHTIGL